MRIINLAEFRKLPEGILFCKYEPQSFGSLQIKGDTWDVDFLCAELIASPKSKSSNETYDILFEAEETGKSFPLEVDVYGRDGLFEKDQLFAIYEESDIEQLMRVLKTALSISQPIS